MKHKNFYNIDFNYLEKFFQTDIQYGLSSSNANEKLESYGDNILLQNHHKNKLTQFLQQFIEPTTVILIISAIISFFIHEYKNL